MIDWIESNPKQMGTGTEMVSRAIETIGPSKVKSISGELDVANAKIYDYYHNDMGFSALEAAMRIPAAKIRTNLGFNRIEFVDGKLVGYRSN